MRWRFCVSCPALLIVLAFVPRAAAQPSAVVFPSDDTWVRQGGHSSQPRGRKKQMVTAATRFGLVKFNLISFLPASTQVKSATLQMVPIEMPPKATIWLLAVGGEWGEAETSDVNAPPIIMVPVGTMDVPPHSNQQSLDADVTDVVRRWVGNPPRTTGSRSRPRKARPSSSPRRRPSRGRRDCSWSSRNRMQANVRRVRWDRLGRPERPGRRVRRA